MKIANCCSGEADNFNPPPPPPRPENCCSGNRCPTISVASSIVSPTLWYNTVTLFVGGCPLTSTYTLQRSYDNVNWVNVGDFSLPSTTLLDNNGGSGFDETVTQIYYRVFITHEPGCTVNCTYSSNTMVSRPSCCSITAILPGVGSNPAPVFDTNTQIATFTILIQRTQNSGCFVEDPPGAVTLTINGSQTAPPITGLGTPVVTQITPDLYEYDYTIGSINPNTGISFNVSFTNFCTGNTLLAGTFSIPGIPACCQGLSDKFTIPNDANNIVGTLVPGNSFNTSADDFNYGGNAFNRTNPIAIREVVSILTEDEYEVNIEFLNTGTCGGNECRLKMQHHLGNIYTGNTGFLSQVNGFGYNKNGVLYAPFDVVLASDNTFFYWGSNPPHDNVLTNVAPPNNAPYLISWTSTNPIVNASINIATGTFTIAAGVSFTMTLRIKVPKELGAGHSPYERGSFTGVSTPEELLWNGRYSNIYKLIIEPINASSPCPVSQITSYLRFPASNLVMKTTYTGSVAGYPINSKSVSQLITIEGTPTTIESMLIFHRRTPTGATKTDLFNVQWRNPFDDNSDQETRTFDRLPFETGGATDVFTNREAFQRLVSLPCKINNAGQAAAPAVLRNKVHQLQVNRWQNIVSYDIAKCVENNFNTIFPNTNTGFWTPHNGSNFTAAGTYPIGAYNTDINIDPIIELLSDAATELEVSSGFDIANFPLTLVFFSEVSNHTPDFWLNGNYIFKGVYVPGAISVSAVTAIELRLDLNTNSIISLLATPVSRISARGVLYPFTNWRGDVTQDITYSGNVINVTNSSTVELYNRTNILKNALQSDIPVGGSYISNNLVITTMNCATRPTTLTDYSSVAVNCDYTGTPYNSLGSASAAWIVNPRILGEVVAPPSQNSVSGKANSLSSNYTNTVDIIERRGRFTSPYCSIATPIIKLGVLDYLLNGYTGRTDFII